MRIYQPAYKHDGDVEGRRLTRYYADFRDSQSRRYRIPLFSDRRASEDFGRRLERLLSCRAAGERPDAELVCWIRDMDPKAHDNLVRAGLLEPRRELLQHLDDYAAYLRSKGNTEKHVRLATARTKAIIEGCKFKHISDVTASAVMHFLAK